jgi:hypothetical protein
MEWPVGGWVSEYPVSREPQPVEQSARGDPEPSTVHSITSGGYPIQEFSNGEPPLRGYKHALGVREAT